MSDLAFTTNWSTTDSAFPWLNRSGTFNLINTSLSNDNTHPEFFRSGGTSGDAGGAFDLISDRYTVLEPATRINFPWIRQAWIGQVVPAFMTGGLVPVGTPPASPKTEAEVFGLGATGISRCIPTNPSFGLSRSIGELRNDGLPSLIGLHSLKNRAKNLRGAKKFGHSAGSEFLNYQFGWLPLLSDVTNLAKAVKQSNAIVRQYRKGSDTKIKRRYRFPTESTSQTITGGGFVQPLEIMGDTMWQGAQTITSQHETSFSGAFRYHVPVGDDIASKMIAWESEANKLLGLRLTPKLVWDLAPWTWAIDWFSNVGDVINNISRLGSDGLVLQYGYVMDGVVSSTDTNLTLESYGGWTVQRCHSTRVQKTLKRRGANWYGFNFDLSALSSTQEAVVVALGLSHGLR